MPFSDTIVVLASDAPAGLLPARQQMAVSLGFHSSWRASGWPFRR